MTDVVRVLIADDEPLARLSLRALLEEFDWIECVGEAADGRQTIQMIRDLTPELIFLDVRMPSASGIDVLHETRTDVPVVFTTAYEDAALLAFELGAIDYLLKPFGRTRLTVTMDRARSRIDARRVEAHADAGTTLRERLTFAQNLAHPLDRIFVRSGGKIILLRVDDAARFEADGDYVAVYSGARRYLVYLKIGDLADRLDPRRFVRIHRSHVVNLDHVVALRPKDASRVDIVMRDGATVPASRAGTQALRARIAAQRAK